MLITRKQFYLVYNQKSNLIILSFVNDYNGGKNARKKEKKFLKNKKKYYQTIFR